MAQQEMLAFALIGNVPLAQEIAAGHAQWYGWSLPLWTAHEWLEATLDFNERLAHHLESNGLSLIKEGDEALEP